MTDQELTRWAATFLWGPEGHNWHFGIEGDLIAHVLPFDEEKELYAFEGDIDFIHDFNHAFQVVERMVEKGFELKMGRGITVQGLLSWVRFTSESYSSYFHDKQTGRAVLLAAKAALEGE